jgi:Zn-dependent protease
MLGVNAATLIARAIVLLIAFTIHELAHAVVADRMGDNTPRRMGRITLNPIAHLDPIGTIALLVAGFGWAKPVMVNPLNLSTDNPRTGMAIVAAAGPLSNVIMALLGALPIRLGLIGAAMTSGGDVIPSLPFLLSQFIWINLILAFFNLIPIPPLDGYKILTGILPPEMAYRLRPLEQQGFMVLLLAVFLLPMIGLDVIGWLVFTPSQQVFLWMLGG